MVTLHYHLFKCIWYSIADAVDELEAAEQEAAEARPFMAKPLFRGKKATLQAMWPKQLFKR